MRRLALALTLLVIPGSLAAWPMFHDVTGLQPGDHLNIRAAPSADADIVGTLAPDAVDVEVTATQGNWARINNGEGAGWVAMRYLTAAAEAPTLGAIACFGTEPFWSLDVGNDGTLHFTDAEGTDLKDAAGPPVFAAGRNDTAARIAPTMSLVIEARECSDGMSDRRYGIAAQLLRDDPTAPLLTGCCALVAP